MNFILRSVLECDEFQYLAHIIHRLLDTEFYVIVCIRIYIQSILCMPSCMIRLCSDPCIHIAHISIGISAALPDQFDIPLRLFVYNDFCHCLHTLVAPWLEKKIKF